MSNKDTNLCFWEHKRTTRKFSSLSVACFELIENYHQLFFQLLATSAFCQLHEFFLKIIFRIFRCFLASSHVFSFNSVLSHWKICSNDDKLYSDHAVTSTHELKNKLSVRAREEISKRNKSWQKRWKIARKNKSQSNEFSWVYLVFSQMLWKYFEKRHKIDENYSRNSRKPMEIIQRTQ